MIDKQISQTEKKHRKGKKISSNIRKLRIVMERVREKERREGGGREGVMGEREMERGKEGGRNRENLPCEFNIPVCTA